MVTIIKKLTGGAYPFYEYACLSTDVKPVSLVPENSICHEIDTGKHYYLANGEWHQLPARGGEGGSLPADFPAESSENANKYLGFDANGDYTAKDAPSGGGAEKFVVTLTQDNGTWTADKTIAEIVAADAAGMNVVASFQYMGQLPTELPKVSWMHDPEGTASLFMFSGIVYGESEEVALIVGQQGDVSDVWQVTSTPIHTSTNEPLIVTLTAGATEGQFVGDKTHEEAFNAFVNGQNCVFYAPSVGLAETVKAAEHVTDYAINTGSFTSEGSASDYITVFAG